MNAVALGVGVVGVGLGGFLLWNASSDDGGAAAAITLTGTGARLDGSF